MTPAHINYCQYADVVRCAPVSECPVWGQCARSIPADPTSRVKPRFQHFGPPPVEGARCPSFIRIPTTNQSEVK
jgi:hypothetical protein